LSLYDLLCFSLEVKFCEWTNFPFLSTIFAHLSSPNSIWILSVKVLTIFLYFWSSSLFYLSASHRPCKKVWYSCPCCVFFISCIHMVNCCVRGIKQMHNSNDDKKSAWIISRYISISSVYIRLLLLFLTICILIFTSNILCALAVKCVKWTRNGEKNDLCEIWLLSLLL